MNRRPHSTLKERVRQFFFLNEGKGVYVNELARMLEADPKNVHRVLEQCAAEGILVSSFQGRQRYFSCDLASPLYKAHKEIFTRTAGVEGILKDALAGTSGLEKAWIFGSYPAGTLTRDSDIDLLCVGKHRTLDVEKRLRQSRRDIGREVNAVHMTPERFRSEQKKTFLKTVFSARVIEIL